MSRSILEALAHEGYECPTPIQTLAIPSVLRGRDLVGIAATGTGKTAAFALPVIQLLMAKRETAKRGHARALVLAPTRELAAQIADSFRTYGRTSRLEVATVVGGVAFGPQVKALAKGVDVLVATPGRLLDHVVRGTARLDATAILVLDEADHMLDLGFIPSVRKLVARMPARRQSLLFSATMPREIRKLADDFLTEPETVSVAASATVADSIDQRLIHVASDSKATALVDVLRSADGARALVFTRTKRGADRVVRVLARDDVAAVAIHGNKSQSQRTRALDGFRTGRTPVLVATDIAARGIDVDDVALVVNYDLPHVSETYVHRIGRTARAGAAGRAVSFCTPDERPLLKGIETLIRMRIPAQRAADSEPGSAPFAHPAEPAGGQEGRARPRSGQAPKKKRAGKRAHPQRDAIAGGARTEGHDRPQKRAGTARKSGAAGTGDNAGLGHMPFMQPSAGRAGTKHNDLPRRPATHRSKRRPARDMALAD